MIRTIPGDVVVAFKMDHPWMIERASSLIPFLSSCLMNKKTVTHSELIVVVKCSKTQGRGECKLCISSSDPTRKHHNTEHYLTYYVTDKTPWQMVIDEQKYFNSSENKWFYLKIPSSSIDSDKVNRFMTEQLDKPWNENGSFCVPFVNSLCCCCSKWKYSRLDDDQYFCSELITMAIQDQPACVCELKGLTPKATSPLILYETLKSSKGVIVLLQIHPGQ